MNNHHRLGPLALPSPAPGPGELAIFAACLPAADRLPGIIRGETWALTCYLAWDKSPSQAERWLLAWSALHALHRYRETRLGVNPIERLVEGE